MAAPIHKKALNFISQETSPLIGQCEAIAVVEHYIQRIAAGYFDRDQAPGIFLFSGSPGVGKVSMTKIIARVFDCPLYRFAMSSQLNSPKLIPFGDSQKQLSLEKNPYSVILLPEIEKAQKNANELFSELFEQGPLIDTWGNEIFAKRSIVIMTTNLCARIIQQQQRGSINDKVRAFSILYFSQGFVDRLHAIVVFYPLDSTSILEIAEKYLEKMAMDIEKSKQIKITWDDRVIPLLVNQHIGKTMSARVVQKNVREGFYKALVTRFPDGELEKGSCIQLYEEREGVIGITKPLQALKDALETENYSSCFPTAKL